METTECYFTPSKKTSSATICDNCGKEKILHSIGHGIEESKTNAQTVKDASKCEHGWHDGSCCCNCINQFELFKHPINTIHKGSILESTGMFACVVAFDLDGEQRATIQENKHGMCELHINKFDFLKQHKITPV